LENKNIKSLYHVKFINEFGAEEAGIDAGGITKEFVMRVVKYDIGFRNIFLVKLLILS
jgi:hypothetical protein